MGFESSFSWRLCVCVLRISSSSLKREKRGSLGGSDERTLVMRWMSASMSMSVFFVGLVVLLLEMLRAN